MAASGNSEQSFLLKLQIDGKEVLVSVTPEVVEALNSEDQMVRHHAYELVAKEMIKCQLRPDNCSTIADTNNNIETMNTRSLATSLNENYIESCPSQVHIWKEDEEKLLLDLRLEKDVDFNSAKNHETLWTQITTKLNDNGINVSKFQARNKFKSLKKKYREIVDENGKTGNSAQKWKYFELFQAAYGHKTSTTPASTFDSSASVNDKNLAPTPSKGKAAAGKRKRQSVDRVIEKIDETTVNLLKQMQSEHEQKMQRMDWFLDIYEKSVGSKSN